MRNRFDRQLEQLNNELINMGSLIEEAIEMAITALMKQDAKKAKEIVDFDEEIDEKEREIESLCLKLLLQQQPVAKDLRQISAALKMITDMERIGDHAADISEMTILMAGTPYIRNIEHLQTMAKEAMVMLVKSIEAYVEKDLAKAEKVIESDDVIDDLFDKIKAEVGNDGEIVITSSTWDDDNGVGDSITVSSSSSAAGLKTSGQPDRQPNRQEV